MKSNFYPTGMGYVYTVGDAMDPTLLTIEVTSLRSRGGSPLALFTTSSTIQSAKRIPGTERVLNAEVWLLSETSRRNYANALESRIPAPPGASTIDFVAMLEEVAQRVIDAENAPLSVVTLSGDYEPTPTRWLIDGMLPAGKATILYGAGGVGKSILAATIAVAVQTGTKFLNLPVHQADVLYLDWETDEADINMRIKAAQMGLGPKREPVVRYVSLVRPVEDSVSQLARQVAEEKIGLVVIDSVGMAMSAARDGSDPSETAIRFFRALRAMDAGILAIDHVSGEDMRKGRGSAKPYGSVYKWNSARNAFELREEREPDVSGSHLLLKHRKSNIGPRLADIRLRMLWENGQVNWHRDVAPLVAVAPLMERIEELLSVAPATPHQLSDLLSEDSDISVSEIEVRRTLKSMVSQGSVTVMADGNARLTSGKDEGLLPS